MSDIIAAHVLHHTRRMETLNWIRDALTANLGLFQNWISEFDSKMRFIPPEAGAMAFVGYDWDINSTKLIEKVREEASVMLVAGDWYGMDHYLRFGYGAKQSDLEAALERITPIFKSL
jgi:aspartate/methionine/tyrosine aminotransferase